ncbi:putative holliday junction resolvase [mine drainage metagenome]|uniref:Putative holliday junction resolvase n=1 Tax=mine drainage metagenome TaxID=410659 RepID=A0A1J5PYQ9_9ZZZZ
MRLGRRLGVDVGAVRVGVAQCDPEGLIATPVATVKAGENSIKELSRLVTDSEVIEVIIGLPTSLSGNEGEAAEKARDFAAKLRSEIAIPIRLVDERLSTVVATHAMRASGVNAKKGRVNIDQVAAVVILQSALDAERVSGRPPGEVV